MSLEQKIADTLACLKQIEAEYSPAIFANSYGAEDMVLTDLIARHGLKIDLFSLDTGRLPAETYTLMQETATRYPVIPVKVYFPDAAQVEQYVNEKGINAFYESVDLRKECCRIRKLEPLKRALAGRKAWITGLRRQQSTTRTEMQIKEFDSGNGLEKFNPLIEWTEKEVWQYIRDNGVPYNALHDQHYPSIGCAPCTRSIAMGEDVRAGRWWWENPDLKECGLHAKVSSLIKP
ncbi:phosphoadenosine phosphosulfate reductase [Andreprevotia lacus DSM 23236]|jgi:phosphoadenosine phosphosulfate reductase|uniref:Adenosine 5'-phosphosulfate reductase n=1 Tax=Andreprevotia lacus DSM 23236 TaxID=1121001 RepID=A0A1W1X7K0_9NEIS|nr:phosphoadenylyl-sulfate reductase [Andreprevotia lacus]SMC19820.1 phosphoadenosine phosphosulfate reductase [Andreprevotia lacus DSM 23236]